MAEIVKIYRQTVPALRFIGKKYSDADRVNGGFSAKWGEWFEHHWFDLIERQVQGGLAEQFEDGDATIGLMRGGGDRPFEYWIGLFVPQHTSVPEGFDSVDFPPGHWGVCWLYGEESELYGNEWQCSQKLIREGYKMVSGWCFERYVCPRFTTPDEHGKILLDIVFYVQ